MSMQTAEAVYCLVKICCQVFQKQFSLHLPWKLLVMVGVSVGESLVFFVLAPFSVSDGMCPEGRLVAAEM